MQKMINRYSTYDPNKIRHIALEQYGDNAYVTRITETISSIVQAKH